MSLFLLASRCSDNREPPPLILHTADRPMPAAAATAGGDALQRMTVTARFHLKP